ncbi:pilus assembly protein TadG-related protein [Neobacillus sp. SAB-20_R2A]|uniref:pilus assembly protein TadG-related protein n=1 Tax=Neobacillus sp. SAB-20_R2A TaxID=3120519 RepID=UPI003C6DC2E8
MLKRLLSEEKGQSMVLVSILLVVLIGFAGLAIDGGRLYMAKSSLQKAVDAGALAGGRELLKSLKNGGPNSVNYTSISTTVDAMAKGNYSSGTYSYDSNQYKTKAVEVQGEENVNLMLMPVLGIDKSIVKAIARVKIGNVSKVGNGVVIPVGINFDILKDPNDPEGTKLRYGEQLQISATPGSGINGYYGYLNFSSIPGATGTNNGADSLYKYIMGEYTAPVWVGLSIEQQSGENTGKAESAITQKEGQIVYVPIVTGPIDGKLIVEGFAAFKLIDYVTDKEVNDLEKEEKKTGVDLDIPESHTIIAEFLHVVIDGEIGETDYDYGVYDSKLEL